MNHLVGAEATIIFTGQRKPSFPLDLLFALIRYRFVNWLSVFLLFVVWLEITLDIWRTTLINKR